MFGFVMKLLHGHLYSSSFNIYSGGQKFESSQYAFALYVRQIRIYINVGIDYTILVK